MLTRIPEKSSKISEFRICSRAIDVAVASQTPARCGLACSLHSRNEGRRSIAHCAESQSAVKPAQSKGWRHVCGR